MLLLVTHIVQYVIEHKITQLYEYNTAHCAQ